MLTIERKLSKAGYMKVNLALLARRPSSHVVAAITILFITTSIPSGSWISPVVAGAYAVFVTVVYAISILNMTFSSSNRGYFLPFKYIIDDTGISTSSVNSQSNQKWDAVIGWQKTAGHYLLQVAKIQYHFIPVSAVPAESIPRFESLLRDKVRKKHTRTWTPYVIFLAAATLLVSLFWILTMLATGVRVGDDSFEVALFNITLRWPLYVLMMLVPSALLITEFLAWVLKRRSRSYMGIGYLPVVLFFTTVGMLAVSLDMWVFFLVADFN